MKKAVLVLVSLLLVVNGYSLLKRSIKSDGYSVLQQKEDKLKIKKEELPEPVKKTLEGEAFKGWTVTNAYKTNNSEYEVELKKGANAQTVKFDKDGKVK